MNKTRSPLKATWIVIILMLLSIVFLLKPTILECFFPFEVTSSATLSQGQVGNNVTPIPSIGQSTQSTVADSGAKSLDQLQQIKDLTISIAERNTAWASYVLSAVGVLLTLVVLMTTVWNELRYSRIHNDWVQLRGLVQSEADVVVNKLDREISKICLPMADFMVRTAIYEKMYPRDIQHPAHHDDYLGRTANAGVKLLVRYAESYQYKQAAVRRLSHVANHTTLDCLNEIERIVLGFIPSKERDDLLSVIHTTREVVIGALNSNNST